MSIINLNSIHEVGEIYQIENLSTKKEYIEDLKQKNPQTNNIEEGFTLKRKKMNNKAQQISNQQNEIEESKQIDKIGNNMEQYEKRDNEKIFENHQYQIYTLYENKYSIVKLSFRDDLNTFIVNKQTLQDQIQFEKEQEMLKQLKGHKITLDIVQSDSNYFEQIAGKTTLHLLKMKTNNKEIFEMYFFQLYDKLNKMHQLGIAHSDIKPQNIVISYDNEAFFIDFDGSVVLSNYYDYLDYFTPSYNLDCYIKKEIRNKKIKYSANRIFQNEEEIKLVDRTQLVLTFLYLFSDKPAFNKLFKKKDFNSLINSLFNHKNRLIISIFSRILNQADQNIQIRECKEEYICRIDSQYIDNELYKTNDIVFNEENNIYKVQRIDKFSISLLYFLDKQCCNIEIIPKDIIIIPLLEMYEYQYICSKYKQINRYFDNLINKKRLLSEIEIENLSEYMKVGQNKQYSIYFSGSEKKLLKTIQNSLYIDSINFKFKKKNFQIFLGVMMEYLSEYNIQSFIILEKKIECKVQRQFKQEKQIINDVLNILISDEIFYTKDEYLNLINNNQCIKQIDIIFQSSLMQNNVYMQRIIELLEDVKEILQQLLQQYQFKIQIKRSIRFQENHFIIFNNKLKNYNKNEDKQKQLINQINYIYEINQSTKYKCYIEDQDASELREILSKDGENLAYQTILNIFSIEIAPFKLILYFYNFLFLETKIWQQLIQIIQNDTNQIEIKLINCEFSKSVETLLKESTLVQIEEYNEYEEERKHFQQEYQIDIQYNLEQSIQKKLKVLFYKYFKIKNQSEDKNYQSVDKLMNLQQNKFDQPENGQEQKAINIESIKRILMPNGLYKMQLRSKIEIVDGQQTNTFGNEFIKKQAINIQDKEDIYFIIEELNNKVHYQEILINTKQNYFRFFISNCYYETDFNIIIRFDQDSNQLEEWNQFNQLYIAIAQNNKYYQNVEQDKYLKFYFNQDICFIKQYSSYQIQLRILVKYGFRKKYCWWTESNDYDNTSCSKQLQHKLRFCKYLKYEFIFSNEEKKISKQFIDNFKDFKQQYYINETDYYNFIFENNDYFVEFHFKKLNFNDKEFSILFKESENLFPNEKKYYNFKQCRLTGQTLHNLYQTLQESLKERILKFDLRSNNISISDLKQFIEFIVLDKSNYQFIFEITQPNNEISQFNEFKNELKIQEQFGNIILEYQPKNKSFESIIKIVLAFKDIELKEQPKIQYNQIENQYNQDDEYDQYQDSDYFDTNFEYDYYENSDQYDDDDDQCDFSPEDSQCGLFDVFDDVEFSNNLKEITNDDLINSLQQQQNIYIVYDALNLQINFQENEKQITISQE